MSDPLDADADDEITDEVTDEVTDELAGTISWRELLAEATVRFTRAGLAHGAADARRVIEEAAGVSPADLLLVLDELVTERAMARYDDMVLRREGGEPLQYVLGSWAFRTLDLMVDRRVLIPRPETEQVVEVALAELDLLGGRERATTVVDLGTGSGAIGLSIAAERVRTTVWLTDVADDALDVARANTTGLGRAGARVRVAGGSWYAALPQDLRRGVELVVTNPPYVATVAELPAEVADWEPAGALWSGEDGLDDLRTLLAEAGEWLVDDGVFVSELSPEQSHRASDLAAASFQEVRVEPDLTGRDRTLVARRPRR
ncbi:MAG: peptide chain release factor N(5)-glutamine methyltransferase [Microthrixaceae bacterium]